MSGEINEECGVVGVYGSGSCAELVFLGLYSLQHRGQESAGISTSDGTTIKTYKKFGLVKDVFGDPAIFQKIKGTMAIGHNRYSTTGSAELEANIQPICVNYKMGALSVAHNGNLTNSESLRKMMESEGHIFSSSSDTETIPHLTARSHADTVEGMFEDAIKQLEGAFSIVALTEDKMLVARDRNGFKPLAIGKLENTYVIASETCAFDIMGASYIRDVEPGELIVFSKDGIVTKKYAEADVSHCVFEYIYFSRPDSTIFGQSCDKIRRGLGMKLAQEYPVEADIVVAVPDSSNTIALGYAKESKIPFEIGLLRNHYVGRTFIQPHQNIRDLKVKIKFNPIKGVLKGKKIVLVDDSIVRGTTIKKIVAMLKEAEAKEIHLRIGSPAVKSPCFYGMDFPSPQELIANNMSTEEVRKYLGVNSLGYLTLEGLMEVVKDSGNHCHACFSGHDPLGKENITRQKDILEK